ncbi:MAG: ankyrin repeat domain-containing protein [Burkholderiaceae bacterium]|nr:ankyrin repeat domain-containing protein [Burkholderiaceae bacterium]
MISSSPYASASVFIRRLIAGLAVLMFSSAVGAAVPSDWWVNIANDRVTQVQQMLGRGVDPNEFSSDGQPAIMQAIRDGAWKVYDVLVKSKKTDVNAVNVNDETPLMYLAVVGETARAQALIQRGAQVNRLGWTPLHYAASKGHLDMARLLITKQAIINAPGPDGTTPLMMAAYSGSAAMVQLLLDAGADVTTLNLQKQDAADWARLKKHTDLGTKLDVLTQKVLAQRAAMRQAGTSTPPQGTERLRLDQANGPSTPSATQDTEGAASTSKYFDLDRFK